MVMSCHLYSLVVLVTSGLETVEFPDGGGGETKWVSRFNLHEYFESAFTSVAQPMMVRKEEYSVQRRSFGDDKRRFADEVVVKGRKSDGILNRVTVSA